jgi:hypothetical protein
MVNIFLQTFFIKVGWIIYTGMLSLKLNYTFSDMRKMSNIVENLIKRYVESRV